MEKTFIFKESEITFIITELSRLPYNQVARIINYIDVFATKQIKDQSPQDQIAMGIADAEK